jgi:hypothetical protein
MLRKVVLVLLVAALLLGLSPAFPVGGSTGEVYAESLKDIVVAVWWLWWASHFGGFPPGWDWTDW